MTTELEQYRAVVSRLMQAKYGVTWADACGDLEPLEQALADRELPEDFVERYATKYDLDPITMWSY